MKPNWKVVKKVERSARYLWATLMCVQCAFYHIKKFCHWKTFSTSQFHFVGCARCIIYWWDIKESTIFFVISIHLCETSRRNFSTISKITHNLRCWKLREKKAWVFVYISSNCTVWNQLKLISDEFKNVKWSATS